MGIMLILREEMGIQEFQVSALNEHTTVYREFLLRAENATFFLTRQKEEQYRDIFTFSFVPAWGNGDRPWYTYTWTNTSLFNPESIIREILKKIRLSIECGGEIPFEWPF